MIHITVEYCDCDYPMTEEALEYFLANPPIWENTNGQLFAEQEFYKRNSGFRLEFKKHDSSEKC